MLIASKYGLKNNMDLTKWFPTVPIGVDGTALNPDRITTLEEILTDHYGPRVSLLSLERLKSRKNIVVHLQIIQREQATPIDIVAKMFIVDKFDIETKILRSSWEKSLTVPEVVEARNGVILMDYISGEPLVDLLNRTFDPSLTDLLAEWYYNFHHAHDMIKGDPRLRNFIHNNGRIYGVDYEESRPDHWILDIGGAAASLLDTDPIFDIRKQKMCWTLLETYLDIIDEKRTSEIEIEFNETVADTLKQTAIWRKNDKIMSISEDIRENGIPFG
jgi:tRNA A-37 threonylcarbamoyl transferase component Bud32